MGVTSICVSCKVMLCVLYWLLNIYEEAELQNVYFITNTTYNLYNLYIALAPDPALFCVADIRVSDLELYSISLHVHRRV